MLVGPIGALAILLLVGPALAAPPIVGSARVIDGDTLDISGIVIRLEGVDAPELSQRCDGPVLLRACGARAADFLAELVRGRPVTCQALTVDAYDRLVARCEVAGQELSRTLVEAGFALAFVRYSTRLVPAEAQARASRAGLWQAVLEAPWAYRNRRWAVAAQSAPHGCPIKGNISRAGERIYHTPWSSRSYGRTRLDLARGERWFCSEREALAAGRRAPRR